mgnify:CR=1 FL=1
MHEPWQSALRLQLTPGLGLRRARALVQHLGGCAPALQAPDRVLRDALGLRLWTALRALGPGGTRGSRRTVGSIRSSCTRGASSTISSITSSCTCSTC